jgi:hypothetical protein
VRWLQPGSQRDSEPELGVKKRLQADSQLRVSVAEAGGSSGTQRKENVHPWKTLPSRALQTMTKNINLCVILICKV